ncbi:globin family protein [Actinomadura sediminis]|uniref:Uncharacterized protein n=1 Tax=Actinomadura sediminis TaxID=1038904 RepID=A0ABW3EHQ7_9ACTN
MIVPAAARVITTDVRGAGSSVPAVYEWAGGAEAFERLTEVFRCPDRYSRERGGYRRMVREHLGGSITGAQRRRWASLPMDAADEVGLPDDPRVLRRVRVVHRTGHPHRPRELAARRVPAPESPDAALGLGRRAAVRPREALTAAAGPAASVRVFLRPGVDPKVLVN